MFTFFTYPSSLFFGCSQHGWFQSSFLAVVPQFGAVLLCHLAQSFILNSFSVQCPPDAHAHTCVKDLFQFPCQLYEVGHELCGPEGQSWSGAFTIVRALVCVARHNTWQREIVPNGFGSSGVGANLVLKDRLSTTFHLLAIHLTAKAHMQYYDVLHPELTNKKAGPASRDTCHSFPH